MHQILTDYWADYVSVFVLLCSLSVGTGQALVLSDYARNHKFYTVPPLESK